MGHYLTIIEMASTIASQTLINLTQKPLTSQENLLKTQENPQKTTQMPLSPLEQAEAEKLAKLESEQLESGNKIFDFYSDRNFTDFRDARPQPSTSKDSRPQPTTLDEPILHKNL